MNFIILQLRGEEVDAKKITTVKEATYAVAKRRPEKIHAWRESKPELCENGGAL